MFACVQGATGPITLPDVAATPTTEIAAIDGRPLPWKDSPAGIVVDLAGAPAGPDPSVVALRKVAGRPAK